MKPIKVRVSDYAGGPAYTATWVACDSGRAVLTNPPYVFCAPFDALEVLEDVTCDAKGSVDFGQSSESKPPVVVDSATKPVVFKVGDVVRGLDRKDHVVTEVGPVRKRRRKRASSPRGPRSNQWQPEKPE